MTLEVENTWQIWSYVTETWSDQLFFIGLRLFSYTLRTHFLSLINFLKNIYLF